MHDSLDPIVLAIGLPAHLPGLLKDLPVGTAMPVSVGFSPHVFVAGELAESFFHGESQFTSVLFRVLVFLPGWI
jgi:hypothetical protein